MQGLFSLSDCFIIVSGRSDRHTEGIANKIVSACKEIGKKPFSIEGIDKSHWILIDLEGVVVHVFYQPAREHYNLEKLWINSKELDPESFLDNQQEAA
ncbi:UNVERIFIED_CONTAM: hypothetical protein GTU68_028124 [Idotea baltica]|nr:hypothetical protein [Idotea baltica]